MDVTAAISNLQLSKSMGEVQVAVAKKILNMQKQQGAAALQLLNSATTGMNKSGDQLVAAATGLGGQLDTFA